MSFFGQAEQRNSGTTAATNKTGPYEADGAIRMPVPGSASSLAAARKKRDQLIARSGRSSTRLVGGKGGASYVNSFLGDA